MTSILTQEPTTLPSSSTTTEDSTSKKTILYLDVDDTLISECLPGSGFDLRPGVVTQIRVLSKMFDCHWLTHWEKKN